jgi:hypothetical protein
MTTLATAQAMLDKYLQAEAEILLAKETRMGGVGLDRTQIMEDLRIVQKGRAEWERRVQFLTSKASGTPTFGGARFSLADVSNPQDW